MTYSKRVREQAAMICAVAASTPYDNYYMPCMHLGIPLYGDARFIAGKAWFHIRSKTRAYLSSDRRIDAEAEALIRTGWSPP